MTAEPVSEAVIVRADRLFTGTWGDDSALALVFELPDGRMTEPTYLPGRWQVRDFLSMIDVETVEALEGTRLRVVLADITAARPRVTELLPTNVPDSFRRAFRNDP